MDGFDVYTDFLLANKGLASATLVSSVTDGKVSHDSITRFLASQEMGEKDLWLRSKRMVREFETADGCIIFDDTVIAKPSMDENEIVCWHYDHNEGRNIKGIGLLSAFYWTEKDGATVRIPIGYRIIAKTEEYTDKKTGKKCRRSPKSKNEMMHEMVEMAIRNEVKFSYVLADSWFCSSDNMRFINGKGKKFIFEVKSNRLVATALDDRNNGNWKNAGEVGLPKDSPVAAWLKECDVPVLLFRQTFENKGGSTGERILATNELDLTGSRIAALYKRRWSVEEYHQSLKQNASIGKSPAHTVRTQGNHIFLAICAFLKLERAKLLTSLNHFAIKAKLSVAAVKAAMNEWRLLYADEMPISA
jgi:hypothetical protein